MGTHHLEDSSLPVKDVDIVFRTRFVIVVSGEKSEGVSDYSDTDGWVDPLRFFHK